MKIDIFGNETRKVPFSLKYIPAICDMYFSLMRIETSHALKL